MSKFLRDSIWQFISAILGLIAIILTVLVFTWQRPIRQLRIVEVSNVALISVNPDLAGDIKVYFKDRLIQSAFSIDLRLENTGNQSIVESDYSKPLVISFPPSVEILAINYLSLNPADIGLQLSPTISDTTSLGHQLQIQPLLLNPGDSATFRLIVAGSKEATHFTIDGRVVGVKEIEVVTLDQALTNDTVGMQTTISSLKIILPVYAIFLIGLFFYLRWRMQVLQKRLAGITNRPT
jgi:hypothetical protein